MLKRARSLFAAVVTAVVVSTLIADPRGQAELADLQVAAHLVEAASHCHEACSPSSHDEAHGHHHEDAASGTHHHRHSSDEPEHAHSSRHSAFLSLVADGIPIPQTALSRLDLRQYRSQFRPVDEDMPAAATLSSALRPPIA
jgi:hypothetical protein